MTPQEAAQIILKKLSDSKVKPQDTYKIERPFMGLYNNEHDLIKFVAESLLTSSQDMVQ